MIYVFQFLFDLIAGGHPDDDVEVINGGNQPGYQPSYQPGYQPTPSNPSVPSVPSYPLIPSIPSYPNVPVYPSYPVYPTYPTYPTYFPFGWSYNLFNGFSSELFCDIMFKFETFESESCNNGN